MNKILASVAALVILCTASGFAAADDSGSGEMRSWSKKEAGKTMMGKHSMSGTVENIDHQSGMFKLKTAAGDLMLHFPAKSTMDVKNGDMITVHLSYSMGEGMMKGERMMKGKMMEEKVMKEETMKK